MSLHSDINTLAVIDRKLHELYEASVAAKDHQKSKRTARDRAILLLSFWLSLDPIETSKLERHHFFRASSARMLSFNPPFTGGAIKHGTWPISSLPPLRWACPVAAFEVWQKVRDDPYETLFPRIDPNGSIRYTPLHPVAIDSIVRMLILENSTAAGVDRLSCARLYSNGFSERNPKKKLERLRHMEMLTY